MTRVRWIVGGLVGLAALVIAVETAAAFVAFFFFMERTLQQRQKYGQ